MIETAATEMLAMRWAAPEFEWVVGTSLILTLFLLKLFDGLTGRVVGPLAEGCVVGLNGLQFVGADVDPPRPMVTA